MEVIITDSRLTRSVAMRMTGWQLAGALGGVLLVLLMVTAGLYHLIFVKAVREDWPVFGSVVRFVAKDQIEQRDRFTRENIDVLAKKLGEMQAKMTQLESLGERLSGLAGVDPALLRSKPGRGGALIDSRAMTVADLQAMMDELDHAAVERADVLTLMETRLFDQKMRKMMLPTQAPVDGGVIGSGFGWRIDPFTGSNAMHEGLDFPSAVGTPIYAAAGGVVVVQQAHPNYGNMVEIDHGNDLLTRYGHASRVLVKSGDVVKRGQKIAEIGTSGRSTGPHLHFEVLVRGVAQDPQKFLQMGVESKTALREVVIPGPGIRKRR
jgi:murein DD-endopeptidase MepM/ murein hydrolase activator NlpD